MTTHPTDLDRTRATRWGDTGRVITGTAQRGSVVRPLAPPLAAADLGRIRGAVSAALTGFLEEQRTTLSGMDPALTPVVDEVCALADGGKRLRPSFAYWG